MNNGNGDSSKKDEVKGFLGDRAAELLEDDEATSDSDEEEDEEEPLR